MPASTREQLGDTILNRAWYLDVDTTPTAAATWAAVNGISEFQQALDVAGQDVSDFSSDGWADSQAGGKSWTVTAKVWRKRRTGTVAYDPGQEYLRLKNGETVHVRYYEMGGDGSAAGSGSFPRVEAYEGRAFVKWAPEGGSYDAPSAVTITLTGKGARTAITHPAPNV